MRYHTQCSRQLSAGGRQSRTQRGFMGNGPAENERPGLKEGCEPDLLRQGRLQPTSGAPSSVATEQLVPMSAPRRAAQQMRRVTGTD
jgi:hypothetical protein